jgi:hypothetical protein
LKSSSALAHLAGLRSAYNHLTKESHHAQDYSLDATPANEQRRKENTMSDEWVKEFLHRVPSGHIATHWDDQPFITPTSFWYDEAQYAIFFHSNIVGRIRANSERHDQVCFEASAHGEFLPSNVALEFTVQYQSVVLSNLDRQRLWLSLFSIKQMREDQQSVVPHHKWQIHPVRFSQYTEEREVIYLGSDHIVGDVHCAANPLLRPGAPVPPIQP